MKLDIVLPTYNRVPLLTRSIESVIRARRPAGMEVRLFVVDNNSGPETRETVDGFARRAPWITYVHESRQGLSHARNAGIAAGSGDFVGMIDDDEEIAENWLEVAYGGLSGGDLDFIGGPYHGRWVIGAPDWLPRDFPAVIGVIDGGPVPRDFGEGFSWMLMGGNAIVRRALLDQAGPYNTSLGRTANRLSAGEDEEMFRRLLAVGGRGRYLPDLVIYHHIPPERLTKRYHRRWAFWHSASMGYVDSALGRAEWTDVPYLFGLPRYKIGAVVRSLPRLLLGSLGLRAPATQFNDELHCWSLAGLAYGKMRTTLAETFARQRPAASGA